MKLILGTITVFFLALSAPHARAEGLLPAYFDVTGVRADDVLNLRRGPDARTPIVDTLPPDATGVVVVARSDDGKWGMVRYNEGTAWASLRFLQRAPGQGDEQLPHILACGGNEPFWGLSLSLGNAVFDEPGGAKITLQQVWEGSAAGMQPHDFGVRLQNETAQIHAVISRGQCSDGMSDMTYGFSIRAILSGSLGKRMLAGCCALP